MLNHFGPIDKFLAFLACKDIKINSDGCKILVPVSRDCQA